MLNDLIINYIKKFIQKTQLKDYIGIIVYGSYVGNRNNNLSDLDLLIIKEDYNTSDCGSIIIDGIRIEYFIQGIGNLYKLIKTEIANNNPSHLTKFATCEIVFDKDGITEEFVNYARQLYNIKINESFNDYDKFDIFSINNRIEDLEGLISNDSFYAVYFITLERIRNIYAKINGIIELPLTKIERIYTDLDFAKKYISSSSHNLPNQEFITLYLECLKIKDKQIMLEQIKMLFGLAFNELDFNPNNFTLKFTQKSPFRV